MLISIWLALMLVQLIRTDNANDSMPPISFICDDEQINDIADELKLVKLQLEELKKAVADIDVHIISNAAATASYVSTLSNALPNVCQRGRNGIQWLQIQNSKLPPFLVNCIQDSEQGDDPWILIQRRRDGSVDFYRNWSDYQQGFGNLEGEFFIGLDKLHALTQSGFYELWIKLKDLSNETRWERYSTFSIGDESQLYALNSLGSFTGNAGDSLTHHLGYKFTTKDNDNDIENTLNCAERCFGAWWYSKCSLSNLNGKYLRNGDSQTRNGQVISWASWRHTTSIKYVHMAIRPVKLN